MEVEAMEALDLAGRGVSLIGHLDVAGKIYNKLGYCNDRLGDYSRAIELFDHYKAVAEEAGDLDGQATAVNNKGNCPKRIGSHDSAIELYETAQTLHERLGDKGGIAQNLDNIGICLQKMGRHREAIPLHEEAWDISTAIGFEHGQMRAALWRGAALGCRCSTSTTNKYGTASRRRCYAKYICVMPRSGWRRHSNWVKSWPSTAFKMRRFTWRALPFSEGRRNRQ